MKKLFFMLIVLVGFLYGCTVQQLSIKNMEEIEGEYYTELPQDTIYIDLNNYVTCNTKYDVMYNGKTYSSDYELIFNLEDGEITIGRAAQVLTYPCKFMLVASMNPCPCGFYGTDKECKCSNENITRYLGRISGPLLDRIDIQVEVNSIKYENLYSDEKEETSKQIQKRVNIARNIQKERYKEEGIFSNSELTPSMIEKYCKLDNSGKISADNINVKYYKVLENGETDISAIYIWEHELFEIQEVAKDLAELITKYYNDEV